MSRLLLLLVLLPLLVPLPACTSTDGEAVAVEPFPEELARRGTAWPFQPTRMRVHPLTRIQEGIDEQTGEREIYVELMLELLDQFGHSTKGLGELRFELYAAEDDERSDRLLFWLVDMNDLTVNTTNYDWVTRMYRLNLTLPRGLTAQHPRYRLHAFMQTPDGRRLQHEALLDRHRGGS